MSNDYGRCIAKAGLDIKAIKLNSAEPFQWASGFMMPIYNDNRLFLFHPEHRSLITGGFRELLGENGVEWDVIAGTSTSGISPATTFADLTGSPLIYVRPKPKDHGLRNRIEGIDAEEDLGGRRVVLIEDLISTGGSSANAVQGIRDAKGVCDLCISIFHYSLDTAERIFKGEEDYDREGNKLQEPCEVGSLLTYDVLLEVAKETGYLTEEELRLLEEWRADPLGWGEKHGFPKVGVGGKK